MSVDVSQVKNELWRLKNQIKDLEETLGQWQEQSANVKEIVEAGGAKDEIAGIQAEVESNIAELNEKLEPLYKQREVLKAKLPEAPQPAAPKFDVEKHPVFKKMLGQADAEPEAPVTFNTGDIVEAQWTDKQYYKAKIQTILGSKSAPKYHIKFLEYDDNMTVGRESIRALPAVKRKREPEVPAAPVTSTPHVISGPVSVNPEAKKAKDDVPAKDMPVPRRKTIPNKKTLEKGVNSWKNWSSKGVGKKFAEKDSMFRSGTHEGSRVGFTGSGGGMTASTKRMRHSTKADIEADEALNPPPPPPKPAEPAPFVSTTAHFIKRTRY